MSDTNQRPVHEWLPLSPQMFAILLVLLERDRHGYGIMQDAAQLSGMGIEMQPGALYRLLKRMLEGGLVRELERRQVDPESDERRRYYRITALGRQVAAAEAQRMQRWVRASEVRQLLDQG